MINKRHGVRDIQRIEPKAGMVICGECGLVEQHDVMARKEFQDIQRFQFRAVMKFQYRGYPWLEG